MADLTATLANGGIGDNYLKHAISQSGVGEEKIVKIVGAAAMVDADLDAMVKYITTSHGSAGSGDSAFTIGGLGTADGSAFESGTTDTVFLRVQGTGDLTVASVTAAGDAVGNTTFTTTVEAVFKPAK